MALLQMLLRSYTVIKLNRGIHFPNGPRYRVSRILISVPLHVADMWWSQNESDVAVFRFCVAAQNILIRRIRCSVDHASRYNSCKWPTWRIILLLYVYFNSQHVSSNLVFIVRWINCINTTSDMCHSDRVVCRSERNLPDLHTRRSPTRSDNTKCIDTIDSPGDEHEVARNM
jgi:hypothetical protein